MIKKIKLFSLLFLTTIILGLFQVVTAHAPLSGEVDNESLDTALVLTDPLKSWVFYKELHTAGEANYYKFELDKNEKLTTNLLIPISGKDKFLPGIVIMGPGIPDIGYAPTYIEIPNGSHVMAIYGKMPDKAYYEPFTPSSSYLLIDTEITVNEKGTYYIAVFDNTSGGKYSLAIGYIEQFTMSSWLPVPKSARSWSA